jgi:hypothetical protein
MLAAIGSISESPHRGGRGSWAGPLCAPMGKEGGITTAREREHGEGREMWAQRYEKVGKKSGGNKTI